MKKERMLNSIKMLVLTTICILLVSAPALALPQSKNVAVIGSPTVINGGNLPTDSGITGLGITFYKPCSCKCEHSKPFTI